jgi:hypothetical protein
VNLSRAYRDSGQMGGIICNYLNTMFNFSFFFLLDTLGFSVDNKISISQQLDETSMDETSTASLCCCREDQNGNPVSGPVKVFDFTITN